MTEFVAHETVENSLEWSTLIEQLRGWFTENGVQAPPRQVLTIPAPQQAASNDAGSLLIMPAWLPGKNIGVKVVTFCPWNAENGQSTINAGYMLFDGATGQLSSVLDGDALTVRRTAATSALAADYLVRKDASRHLIVGTGQLAVAVGLAHANVRPMSKISVWGRRPEKAEGITQQLAQAGLNAEVAEDLQVACENADIVSTVTASKEPLVKGTWLRPGSHLDLIGAFRADMRESDDQSMRQAEIFVDGRDSALLSGDLFQPLESGIIQKKDIKADLHELCAGEHPGRRYDGAYTVFKSAGLSLEDLAAAVQAQSDLEENKGRD
ncbi:ornithine cyclodeaminase family protein [Roseibium porphyridii]|uniref:Ornithine cyclodeaminase family protein n=1 Tax=Roseibium porphyridii TaxID=2866279 RepID=A0ABY8FB57_9HYPH|nr:ornithine cyclodeaminase family protein [Roseibium sp. KMA01]WFE89853.1 ornithine cyclodeaminase family protein [Roseibium sp. KMA01]